jgi:hypothetical protein
MPKPSHIRNFTKKRNFIHFRLKGVSASLSSIEESEVLTPGESAKLNLIKQKVNSFNKELFSVSSRRLAKSIVNGVD